MRLKLVVITAALAAFVGAGSSIAIVFAMFSSLNSLRTPSLLIASTFLLPIAAIVFASIFVYRHTAKRRKVQAVLTATLATLLTLTIFILALVLNARRNIDRPGPVTPQIASLPS
jgi:fructose-specific phosphotransferase system IIC component